MSGFLVLIRGEYRKQPPLARLSPSPQAGDSSRRWHLEPIGRDHHYANGAADRFRRLDSQPQHYAAGSGPKRRSTSRASKG
jgi:hypothetical protein